MRPVEGLPVQVLEEAALAVLDLRRDGYCPLLQPLLRRLLLALTRRRRRRMVGGGGGAGRGSEGSVGGADSLDTHG